MPIEVDCTFDTDGWVRVRRVRLGRPWQPVEQGRQWTDADGRHVLVMLPGGARQLVLRADTLAWELRELPTTRHPV
jgi:hypothetical protein